MSAGRAASGRPSKAARLWHRTWVGVLITAALAALLWWSGREEGPLVVLGAGTAIAAASLWETGRMGRLAGRRLFAGAVPALLLLALLAMAAIASRANAAGAGAPLYRPRLIAELAAAAALAAAVRASLGLARSPRRAARPWALLPAALALAALALGMGGAIDAGVLAAGLALAAAVGLALVARLWPEEVRAALWAAALAAWIAAPLVWLVHVRERFGALGLVALVALSKVGDVAGYYVGSSMGRRHPFPSISPGKTVAGCVGSLVAGAAAGVLLVPLGLAPARPAGVLAGLAAGLVVNLAAQAGDLLESWVKRRAGVKDAGSWFGPSGGVLDLVDSLLLAVPAALVAWPWILALAEE